MIEQAAGAGKGAALGIHGEEIVGEKAILGGTGRDDDGMGTSTEAQIADGDGGAECREPCGVR